MYLLLFACNFENPSKLYSTAAVAITMSKKIKQNK